MKKNINCLDCPWCDKENYECSIYKNNSILKHFLSCFYINEDYSITNFGLKDFYILNGINSDCTVSCKKCPYYNKEYCKIDDTFGDYTNFECLYVDKDYNITREGKKKLLEENI